MFIKALEIEGFKGYQEKVVFEFNKKIEGIIGENGTGKSSIGDSIRWLLSGYDASGSDKNTSILLNNKSKKMRVAAVFEEDGKEIKAERTYDGETAVLTVNGKRQTSKAFESLYREKDYLMAMLDMEYIINLPNQKGRDFFMKLLPPVGRDEVVARMKKADKLPTEDIKDTEETLKAIRTKIAKLESEEINLNGRITALKQSIKNPPEEEKFEKQAELDALEKRLKGISASLSKEEELQKKLNEKKGEVQSLTADKKGMADKYYEISDKLKSLSESKCPTCKQVIKDAKEKAEACTKERKEVIKKGKELADKIKTLEAEIAKLDADISKVKSLNDSVKIIEQINALRTEKQQIELKNNTRKTIIENNVNYTKDIKKYEEAIDDIIKKKAEAEEMMEALKEYRLFSTLIQVEKVQQHFNKVSINLFHVNPETKEIKETYEVLWEGKVDKLLSKSEKLKAGMEIADMIIKVTGISIPMFIDNAESITKYNLPDNHQIIIAKVEAGKEIQVIKKEKKAA